MSLGSSNDLDSITVTLSDDNYESNDSYVWSGSNTAVGGITVPWTTGTSILNDTVTLNPNWNNNTSAKIQLDGPDADIEINGESLIDMLQNIEQRLNILRPNETLESEWAELKTLGDQYRELEQHILAKQATWDKLKAMPVPEID